MYNGVCTSKGCKVTSCQSWSSQKKSADQHRPHSNRSAHIRVRPGSNHSQSLMAGIFAALWPIKPKFSAWRDLILFETLLKVQEASNILRVGFALSKWPHFYCAYLLRVLLSSDIAVQVKMLANYNKSFIQLPTKWIWRQRHKLYYGKIAIKLIPFFCKKIYCNLSASITISMII